MNPFEKYLEICPEYFPYGPQPSFDLVCACLAYAKGDDYLPEPLIEQLLWNMQLLKSGRKSELFKKKDTKPSTDPYLLGVERVAVMYIIMCKKTGSDKSPVKTVYEILGVKKSAVHRWKKNNPDLVNYLESLHICNAALCNPPITEEDLRKELIRTAPIFNKNKHQ